MILVIAGSDRQGITTVREFLVARSLNWLKGDSAGVETLTQALADGGHYVITNANDQPLLTEISRRADSRLIFIGPAPSPGERLYSVWKSADKVFEKVHPRDLEQMVAFVRAAMCDFKRPGWDEYFMDIARTVARRSNCMKRQIAAVIVRDEQIIATGYNGTPRGAPNCNEGGCPRCNALAPSGTDLDQCLCNHAEENSIAQAAYHGVSVRGATLYCTHVPCLHCAKLIVNAGITEVVFSSLYPMTDNTYALFETCGVICRKYKN